MLASETKHKACLKTDTYVMAYIHTFQLQTVNTYSLNRIQLFSKYQGYKATPVVKIRGSFSHTFILRNWLIA